MNSDYGFIALWITLVLLIIGLGIATSYRAEEAAYAEIEKKCLYGERLEFSGKLFSCQWLDGITENDMQYERKPHPLKEGLMK